MTDDLQTSLLSPSDEEAIDFDDDGAMIIDRTRAPRRIEKHTKTFFGTKVACYDLSKYGDEMRPSEQQACQTVGLDYDFVRQARRYKSGAAAKLLREYEYDHASTITVKEKGIKANCITLANWLALYDVAISLGKTQALAISRTNFAAVASAQFARMRGLEVKVDDMLESINLRVSLVAANLDYKKAINHNKQLMLKELGNELFDDPHLRREWARMAPVGSGEMLKCLFGMNQKDLLDYFDAPERHDPSLARTVTPRNYMGSEDSQRLNTLERAVTNRLKKLESCELDVANLVRRVHNELVVVDDSYTTRPPEKNEHVVTLNDVAAFRRHRERTKGVSQEIS